MQAHIRKIALAMTALFLSACTTHSLEELRQTKPSGNPFQNALSQYYLKLAEEKEKRYDWWGSMHFADKGLVLAYGNEAGPEDLKDWSIPDDKIAELEKARLDLLGVLLADNMEVRPDFSAQAQYYFDCWVNYTDSRWNEDELYDCREGYLDAMYELTPRKKEVLQDHYTVYFQWGQVTINPDAQKVIDEVVELVEPLTEYDIVLAGHTDASGSPKHNLQLAQKRADAVKEKLIAGGVKEEQIKTVAFGESDPAVKNGKENESRNRRVQITVNEMFDTGMPLKTKEEAKETSD